MTRQTKTSWTDDDFRRLRQYAERGHSAFRIAAALKRSVAGVRTMAQRIGITILSGRAIREKINLS
jgi:hypothetical protein